MKKGFAIMIAGLVFLLIPVLASAHGEDRYGERRGYQKQHVGQRYESNHGHASVHKWERRQIKKHFKKHQRMHQRQHQYYRQYRSHYSEPVVIAGFPSLIFRIDW